MKIFITSINEKLYNFYGRRFIETWKKHAKSDIKLIICFEGEMPNEVVAHKNENINIININTPKQDAFLKKYGNFKEARGIKFYKNPIDDKTLTYSYNYRFDAIRFSFKIFSFIKCFDMDLINSNFAWIDADVVCKKDFDSNSLNSIFPESNQLASYLGRSNFPKPNPYSECGFIGYNINHNNCIDFINEIYRVYENGDLFKLKEWHDCMVFDYTRAKFELLKVGFKNISEHIPEADHPFMQTELGIYFDHLKGPDRKKIGHS